MNAPGEDWFRAMTGESHYMRGLGGAIVLSASPLATSRSRWVARARSRKRQALALPAQGQMPVCELEIALPVVARHVVLARADVVADRAHQGLVDLGHVDGGQSLLAEQAVDGVGVQGG